MSKIVEYLGSYYTGYVSLDTERRIHSHNDEPAIIQYGSVIYAYYIHSDINAKWHRDDAPALIFLDRYEWYNDGIRYNPKCKKL